MTTDIVVYNRKKIINLTTMKTLRLIGTTLLMVMLAVNFTACSDDEDERQSLNKPTL